MHTRSAFKGYTFNQNSCILALMRKILSNVQLTVHKSSCNNRFIKKNMSPLTHDDKSVLCSLFHPEWAALFSISVVAEIRSCPCLQLLRFLISWVPPLQIWSDGRGCGGWRTCWFTLRRKNKNRLTQRGYARGGEVAPRGAVGSSAGQ